MVAFLIVFALAYGLGVVVYLKLERRVSRRKPPPKQQKRTLQSEDILLVRHYTQRHSQPQATTRVEAESPEHKQDTFAPENPKQRSARVPDDELNEAFSNTDQQIVTETVPLEFEEQINLEHEQEEFADATPNDSFYAWGVSYEDMDDAVITATKIRPTKQEQYRAGRTLNQMEGDDIFNQLIKQSPGLNDRILELIGLFVDQEQRKTIEPQEEYKPMFIPVNASDFDIRDFM